MRKIGRKGAAVIAAGALVVGGAGVAYAVWSASGTGSGAASSSSAQNLVVTAGTGLGDLFPSASATGKVSLSIQNPNPYAVTVTALSSDTSDQPGACNVAAAYAGESVSIPVAAGATVAYTSPGNTVTLPVAADDSCQNQVFTFPSITASGTQS